MLLHDVCNQRRMHTLQVGPALNWGRAQRQNAWLKPQQAFPPPRTQQRRLLRVARGCSCSGPFPCAGLGQGTPQILHHIPNTYSTDAGQLSTRSCWLRRNLQSRGMVVK